METRKEEGDECKDPRPACPHGIQCDESGMEHFASFRHFQSTKAISRAKRQRRERTGKEDPPSKKPNLHRPTMYVTKVPGILPRFNETSVAIHIRDILHVSMGTLISSAQFNYMFDINWLTQQYPVEFRNKPMLVIHGDQGSSRSELEKECRAYSNIQLIQAPLSLPFGTHHSKMMLLLYDTGMRVVIHTANLIPRDWELKTQGVWVSPLFPKSSKSSEFQNDLLAYLSAYKRSGLDIWRRHVSSHDMSDANVHLIASVPGRHLGQHLNEWGHMKLRRVLKRSVSVSNEWSVVAQFSSIGSLGAEPKRWLSGEFCDSLSSSMMVSIGAQAKLHLIFPSVVNVRSSLEGYMAGGSLPYHSKTAEKQMYLKRFLHQWRADCMGRSRASPHIKTYTRLSPDGKRIAWFLLTSANLSKAAWGALEKKNSQLAIRSYEIGVLFLPSTRGDSQGLLISRVGEESGDASSDEFPVPFDVPLVPYEERDEPWVWDRPYLDKDSHNQVWTP